MASAGGVSNEQLSRQFGMSVKQIGRIIDKRVMELRDQGLGNHMIIEAQRLAGVKVLMPGWFNKARGESRDENNYDSRATEVLLKLWEREARYMGERDTMHVHLQGGTGRGKVSKEQADEIGLALQQQMRFFMGLLADFPDARAYVVEVLTRSLKPVENPPPDVDDDEPEPVSVDVVDS